MGNLNENVGGKIEIEFQDWLDEMNDKDYPERLTLETVIEYSQDTLRDYDLDDWVPQGQSTSESKKIKKMENLNEGKKSKSTYMTELAEIDRQSALVALEAKINKLAEMAEAKTARLAMVNEDENLSELISKQAVKEMQRSIKEIEKLKEKLLKEFTKKGGKMTEVIDEEKDLERDYEGAMKDDKAEMEEGYGKEKEMEEGYGSTTYEEDDVVAEEEIDEASCGSYEEDDVNEEVNRWQKLAGITLQENKIAQAIRDEAEQPYFKVGADIFYDYAKKIEKAKKKDYRKILQSMERELINTHPDTFDGDDDIVASFMVAK